MKQLIWTVKRTEGAIPSFSKRKKKIIAHNI